jgi:hypothetical protein
MFEPSRTFLLLSLQRGLLGNIRTGLRQASIEADVPALMVRLRFEYEPENFESAQESCSDAAAEVVADLPTEWNIQEEHIVVVAGEKLSPLAYVVYRRAES